MRALNVSPELGNIIEPLPRLKGIYTLQLRLPSTRYQNSNSVRLGLRCADALVPVSVTPPLGLESTPVTVPLPDVRAEVRAEVAAPLPAPPTTPSAPPATPEASTQVDSLPEAADITFSLSRDLAPTNLLVCQESEVVFRVENTGGAAADYDLVETLPIGLSSADALSWTGILNPGEVAEHSYRVRLDAGAAPALSLRAELKAGQVVATDSALLRRADVITSLAAANEPVSVGDLFTVTGSVGNPLARPVTLTLGAEGSRRLELVDGPKTLTLEPNETREVVYTFRALAAGGALMQLTPFACADVAAGTTARAQVQIEEATAADVISVPVRQITTVEIDLSIYNVPVLESMVLLEHLPENAELVAGSSRVDGQPIEPSRVQNTLVFELPQRSASVVSFEVEHVGPLVLGDHTSLIALTPEPEVLRGRADALQLFEQAERVVPVARERVGAVILSPVDNSSLSERDRVSVSVDTPLQSQVRLFVNDTELGSDTLGERVYDPNTNRQTFEYVGVPLNEGPNVLRLESTLDGEILTDQVTVYFAGAAVDFSVAARTALLADSAENLELDLTLQDAYGQAPLDGLVTFELIGASFAGQDASSERSGLQLRFEEGVARLELDPITEAGELNIRLLLPGGVVEKTLSVESNLRPWLATGVASAGLSYDGNLNFGVSVDAFARGRVFSDALLTLGLSQPGLSQPGSRLGERENSFDQFGLPGSSGARLFETRSRQGVFARLERGLDYIQYGDFNTEFAGSLLEPGRTYTGLSGFYQRNIDEDFGISLRAYAAFESVAGLVNTDLDSDGSSIRFLPDAPIEPTSLRLEIVKKDDLSIVIEDDQDELTRRLEPNLDFRVDAEVGLVELYRPVPIEDAAGNRYVLRLSYRLPEEGGQRALQYGVQSEASLGDVNVRLGAVVERLGSTSSRVVATGVALDGETVDADVELAYGSSGDAGGVALSARVRFEEDNLSAEASYRYQGQGYRSPNVTTGDGAGQAANARVAYEFTPDVSATLSGELISNADDVDYSLDAFASLSGQTGSGQTEAAEGDVALGYDAQFGLNLADEGLRPLSGATFYNLGGWQGSRFGVLHRQSLSGNASSVTEFGVALPILSNLNLILTDELVWGQSNALLVGLESDLNTRTRLSAQYELPGGSSSVGGSLRLGAETSLPVSDTVSIELGAERVQRFGLSSDTAVRVAALYDTRELDSSLKYELGFSNERFKQSLSANLNAALSDRFYAGLNGLYILDAGTTGYSFGVDAAYRGTRWTWLATNEAVFGRLAPEGAQVTGDSRLSYLLNERVDVRSGYAYDWRVGTSYLDVLSLGVNAQVWDGGAVLAQGRYFRDWTSSEDAFGLGLELSQNLGCGVYGVGGYNLGGPDANASEAYAGIYGGNGAFIRLDVVFDEQWRCDAASIDAVVWADVNADGVRGENEAGVPGVRIELFNTQGERVAETLSDIDGRYRFSNLDPERYFVRVTPTPGYSYSQADAFVAADGYSLPFVLTAGQTLDASFGLVPVGATP